MIRSRGATLATAVAALVAASAGALLLAARSDTRDNAAGRTDSSFARATGSLGLGAATSPAWSFFGVDPRTEAFCESELFPLPGLPCPDPTHGTGVSAIASRR